MDSYKVQYASDLHLDNESPPFQMLLTPVAPALALCGDIGSPFSKIYYDFLKWCKERWSTVFLITGNHEYFMDKNSATMDSVENKIKEISSELGIHFLQKGVFRDEEHKLLIVGCTLWSSPDIRHWDKIAAGFIGNPGIRGDYKFINKYDEYTNTIRTVHPSDIVQINRDHIAFLEKVCKGAFIEGFRVLVLTHHLPTRELNGPKHKHNPLTTCYTNNLDYMFKEPIVAWICGHSHVASSIRIAQTGTLCTLNPHGYKSEALISGYCSSAVMTIYRENIAIVTRV
jgi:hypothetical protein